MEPARLRASPEQMSALVDYMERHGDLSRPQAGSQGRLRSTELWADLAALLNSIGGGVVRTQARWKKIWGDWKTKTKKKLMTIRRHANGTGGGPACKIQLTPLEWRITRIIGETAVVGQSGVQEHGLNAASVTTQLPPPGDTEVVMESVLPESFTPPPPPATTPPLLPSSPSPLLPPPPPSLTSPGSNVLRVTPRRRRPTQQGARRTRGLTPFDRAASEFSAIERERLRLEERRLLERREDLIVQRQFQTELVQTVRENNRSIQQLTAVMCSICDMVLDIVTEHFHAHRS